MHADEARLSGAQRRILDVAARMLPERPDGIRLADLARRTGLPRGQMTRRALALAKRRLIGLRRSSEAVRSAFLISWVRDSSWPFRVALARERDNLARQIAAIDGLFDFYERDGRETPPPGEIGMEPIVVHRDGRPWIAVVPAAALRS